VVVALLILSAAPLGLVGCSGPTTLGDDDDGATVDLVVGEEVVVELIENPTTGYEWYEDEPSPEVLLLLIDEYESDPAPDDMVGVGGTRRFTYEAVKAGDGVLSYTHQNLQNEVIDEWSVTLRVEEAE
jgi:predicted secreted protein